MLYLSVCGVDGVHIGSFSGDCLLELTGERKVAEQQPFLPRQQLFILVKRYIKTYTLLRYDLICCQSSWRQPSRPLPGGTRNVKACGAHVRPARFGGCFPQRKSLAKRLLQRKPSAKPRGQVLRSRNPRGEASLRRPARSGNLLPESEEAASFQVAEDVTVTDGVFHSLVLRQLKVGRCLRKSQT